MDIDAYRLYEFYTLVLPLMISLCISVVAYGKMREKYMEVRVSYEPQFCETKEYKRYLRSRQWWDTVLTPFQLKDDMEDENL